MQVCGQHFSADTLERIQTAVDAEPGQSRRALSRQVCEWLDWRGVNGRLQDMSCRKALAQLDSQGLIALPERSETYAFEGPAAQAREPVTELAEVSCSLAKLGEVDLWPVSSRYSQDSQVWRDLMDRFHPRGNGPLCGAQIRYVVRSPVHGWLGALSFSAATWRLKDRDEWIGWSEAARRAHLHQVVCNSRFLILPSVRVPHLASHVLSRALGRLGADWQERYAYAPVLVETFVEGRQGTSYRAANWIQVGQTAARATPFPNGRLSDGKKQIYVYRLHRNWRSTLCAAPERPLGSGHGPEHPADWIEEEFGGVELYDDRLKERLFTIGRDFFARPQMSLPQACDGSQAKTKAAYRFFKNKQVNLQTLLRPHVEATVARVREHPVVLAVQDTTSFNYTAHPTTTGMGPISTRKDANVGMHMHDTMAFTPDGVPLGLLDVQCWTRDPKDVGKKHRRAQLPIEEKESMKWLTSYRAVAEAQALCPDTMLVSTGDREADLYELFADAQGHPNGPQLLVRAERTRNRKVEEIHLWDRLDREPVAGYQELYIPRRKDRKARTAKLAVRYAQVTLKPPRGKGLDPVTIWAVHAKEVDYPPGVKRVEWMLLTTVAASTFDEACERLGWYARRWGIEVYHRTIKSGCKIEDRRLGGADRLAACLAIDLVVAWRVYQLTQQGRETPDLPCDVYLSEEEWIALHAYVKRQPTPATPPSLRDAVRMLAKLGGFLGRKSDGEPGTTTMWRGLQRLADITAGYWLGRSPPTSRAGP